MLSPPGELLLEERFQALERNFKAVVGALRLRGPSPALDALVSKLDADQKHWVMRKQGSSSPLAKLLEERDGELERYDSSFSSLKSVIRDRDVELSELKIAAAELQHASKQERDRAAEAESSAPAAAAEADEPAAAAAEKKAL